MSEQFANIIVVPFTPIMDPTFSQPRFTGCKPRGKDVEGGRFGLFGLLDSSTRLGLSFESVTIEDVLCNRIEWSFNTDAKAYQPRVAGEIKNNMLQFKAPDTVRDHSVKWLDPFEFVADDGKVWQVYLVTTGAHIRITGTHKLKCHGFYDYGVWESTARHCEAEHPDMARFIRRCVEHGTALGYPPKAADHSIERDVGEDVCG